MNAAIVVARTLILLISMVISVAAYILIARSTL
jgi:hypothetical protein